MRRVILTLAVTLAVALWAAPAAAQEGGAETAKEGHRHGHGKHDPAAHVEHLREKLDLTDEQAGRIEAILTETMERHETIRESASGEEAREQMRALHEETMVQVSEVLTEEQRATLEEMHREMMERHEKGHHDGHGEGDGGHEGHRGEHAKSGAKGT